MRIKKILNNNAVIGAEFGGRETLLLGSGLGFQKRVGSLIDRKAVEKEFLLSDPRHLDRYEQIMATVPPEYALLAERIIDYASQHYHMELAEAIHISLVDHLYNAVCNYEDGVSIPNSLVDDIARFYPDEYDVGRHAVRLIEEMCGIGLPDDEAGFVAMHFVTAQQKEENINAKKMITFVREINDRIVARLGIEIDESSISYYRYMTHLKCFAQRVMQDFHYPEDNESVVLATLMEQHPREYECSKEICHYIRETYGYRPGIDEEIYLAVHLARLSYRGNA